MSTAKTSGKPTAILLALISGLTGCAMAPIYHAPVIAISEDSWKNSPWQHAKPSDTLARGEWWKIYHDPILNQLETKIDNANPDLAAALARYDQAQAYIGQLQSKGLPTIDGNTSITRNRQSDNRPLRGANQPDTYGNNTLGISANYELDIWGRIRDQVIAGKAAAQASAADLEAVRLSLHAELADNYIRLRGVDAQARLLTDTVNAYTRAWNLTRNRHAGGIASGLDVARAQTQLSTAKAQIAEVAAQRAVYEHAIASLIGEPAMNFSIPVVTNTLDIPTIPISVPSTLLQRRPDIAAAERRTAQANATIGSARAAFFPSFSLSAMGGYQNTGGATSWLMAPNSFWTLGPGVVLNLFDAGLHQAQLDQARAALDEAGAKYRATVLAAFQQVQDDLSQLTQFQQEATERNNAVNAANKTMTLALNRYREGAINYLEVVTAQTAALEAQRSALDLHTRQLHTSISLVRALGGGWSI